MFEKYPFFTDFRKYLLVEVSGPRGKELDAWKGYLESRLRLLAKR